MLLNINDDIDDNNNIDNDIEYYLNTYVPRLLRGISTECVIAQFLPFRYDMFIKKIDYKTYQLFDNIRLIYTLSINRKNKKEERKKKRAARTTL
jgi:hypothetical protein